MPSSSACLLAHWRERMDAVQNVSLVKVQNEGKIRTLQELLAGVLLEEGLVGHWAGEVVNHETEDWVNLLLVVSGIVGDGSIPSASLKNLAGQVHGTSSDLTWKVLHEAVVEKGNLHKVLSESTGLDIVVIGLGDTSQEVHWVWVAQVVVECGKNVTLGAEDLLLSESIVGDMTEVLNVWRQDLLVLGRNEHGSDTNELETVELDNLCGQEAVEDVDSKEESLWQEVETGVNLDQPIDKDTTHLPLQIFLVLHVLWVWQGGLLKLLQVLENLVDVLGNHQWIIDILGIQILNLLLNDLGNSLSDWSWGVLDILVDLDDLALCLDHDLLLRWLLVLDDGLLYAHRCGTGCSLLSDTSESSGARSSLQLSGLLIGVLGDECISGRWGTSDILGDAGWVGCLGDETLGNGLLLGLDDGLALVDVGNITKCGALAGWLGNAERCLLGDDLFHWDGGRVLDKSSCLGPCESGSRGDILVILVRSASSAQSSRGLHYCVSWLYGYAAWVYALVY